MGMIGFRVSSDLLELFVVVGASLSGFGFSDVVGVSLSPTKWTNR
jgi:hypothetical protein